MLLPVRQLNYYITGIVIIINLIILAAGKGTRLGKLTENVPKPLLPLRDGNTILDKHLASAAKVGCFKKIYLVTGYNADAFDRYLQGHAGANKLETIFNPQYDSYGPLVSLWTARQKMLEEDFVIVNGDTIYRHTVFEKLNLAGTDNIILAISNKDNIEKDDMKVVLDRENHVVTVSKVNDDAGLVSAGAALVAGAKSRRIFVDKLNQVINEDGPLARKGFWHEIFNLLVGDSEQVNSTLIGLDQWKEIDTIEDLNNTAFCQVLMD